MGYNVNITGADFVIPADKLEPAFEALKALNKRDDIKSGRAAGTRPDGTYGIIEQYFSWMPANYDETCKDAEAVFKELGFETYLNEDGGLELTGYDSKAGDEDHFLEAVAPFVTPGSWIEWEGEDGTRWRHEFEGATITARPGRTVWE